MPNHITTDVEITGTKQQIAKLIKNTKIKLDNDAGDNEFDLNGIIKMPEELLNTTSPNTIVETDEEAEAKNKVDREIAIKHKWPGRQTDRYMSQAEHDRRMVDYGADNWYDWANRYWGTKWNAYEVRYIDHSDTRLVLSLQTAWDTPRAIWNELEGLGYTVKGVIYGEMDGYEHIGDGSDVFEAYENVEVEYVG